jgi:hypothetical protein
VQFLLPGLKVNKTERVEIAAFLVGEFDENATVSCETLKVSETLLI